MSDQGENAEQHFTLGEARRKIAEAECEAHGHSWDVLATVGEGPVEILCTTCSASHAVLSRSVEEEIATRVEMTLRHVEQNKVRDVVRWLDEQDQSGYIGPNYKQVVAREVAEHFNIERPRDHIDWYDDGGFAPGRSSE